MNDTPPAAADATVDTLLTAYLRALDETQDVPAFSPWRYAALFGELVRWEFAFLALVFVAPLLKLIRLCLRRFGADVPRGPTSLGWQEVKRPFQAIWRGDISALQVVRMRVLTRTFIGSHIVGVVEQLKLVAERARLDALMAGPARADDLATVWRPNCGSWRASARWRRRRTRWAPCSPPVRRPPCRWRWRSC